MIAPHGRFKSPRQMEMLEGPAPSGPCSRQVKMALVATIDSFFESIVGFSRETKGPRLLWGLPSPGAVTVATKTAFS